MNTYRAVINHKSMGTPIIIEQDRERLGMDFIKPAQILAIDLACELGIDAEHDHLTITITRNEEIVCMLYYINRRYDNHMACHVIMVNFYGIDVKVCTMRIVTIPE